ncbi:cytochrome c maturation protein CcmE [Chloroflexi bacterium CFX6]|nr:cytochrome c maturation protein CcmE [Chloroflexi bacterium CFX6]
MKIPNVGQNHANDSRRAVHAMIPRARGGAGERLYETLEVSYMTINKFVIGGFLILGAVVFLIWSSTAATSEYFLTVDELNAKGADVLDRNLRVSGAVIGETIKYDAQTLTLSFEVAHVPAEQALIEDEGGLAEALHQAVIDPARARLKIVYVGPMPDLLRHEAQAIVTGKLGADGVFHADELLLKCPTKYEEAVPEQSASR